MTREEPPAGAVVVVTWTDANYQREQSTEREALEVPLPKCRTYGLLLEASPERVVVAGEAIDEPGQRSYRSTTVIPRGMVRRVRSLGPS